MDSGLRRNDGKGAGEEGMTALRCVIDMTIRLGGANCKGALSYWGRWGWGTRALRLAEAPYAGFLAEWEGAVRA